MVPLGKFTMKLQRCQTIYSGTGHLEVASHCKYYCLLTWHFSKAVIPLGKFTTELQRYDIKPFPVELVTLRLPVVVSAVIYYYGNAAIFKENYNAALQCQKDGL